MPYLSTEYLRNGVTDLFVEITDEDIVVNEGEIMLLWDGSNAGEFFISKYGVLASTFSWLLQKSKNVHKRYLFYLLKQKVETVIKSHRKGTGIPHVDKNVLNNIKIPIPLSKNKRKSLKFLERLMKR